MGPHKWDPVVNHLQVPAPHTSASPTDHDKSQLCPKRVVLQLQLEEFGVFLWAESL